MPGTTYGTGFLGGTTQGAQPPSVSTGALEQFFGAGGGGAPPPSMGGGGGGGMAAPPPQMGDIDPSTGLRLGSGGQWLPQNFFSDLGGGGGGGGDGGGGGGGGGFPPLPGASPTGAPGTGMGPLIQQQPGQPGAQFNYLEMPEQLYGFVPEQFRPAFANALQQFLRGQGFQGMGSVGRFGEQMFSRGATGPIYFDPQLFGNMFSDPNLAKWVQYLLGERGFTQRVNYPGA